MGMTREKAIKEYVIPALMHTWNEKINKEVLEALEQEPTTKSDLAQERYQDLKEYFGDKETAKTILEDRKEFKAWLERLRWHVKRADELARELEQIKEATKNDLGVDCISRVDALSDKGFRLGEYHFYEDCAKMRSHLKSLPSVTPYVPTTKNDSGIDCIDRQATLDAIIKRLGIKNETYLLEAERKIYQQILAMPSVIPQESRWISVNERLPEKSGKYWCTFGTNLTGSDYYTTESDAKKLFDDPEEYAGWRSQNVVAWMPLPKAYREVEK